MHFIVSRSIILVSVVFLELFFVASFAAANSRAAIETALTQEDHKEALRLTKLLLMAEPTNSWAEAQEQALEGELLRRAKEAHFERVAIQKANHEQRLELRGKVALADGDIALAREVQQELSALNPRSDVLPQLQQAILAREKAANAKVTEIQGNAVSPTHRQAEKTKPEPNLVLYGGIAIVLLGLVFMLAKSLGGRGHEEESGLDRRIDSAPNSSGVTFFSDITGTRFAVEEDDIAGKLRQVNLMNFLQFLNGEEKTGVLFINTPDKNGEIAFIKGNIDDAKTRDARGTEALHIMLEWTDGRFLFRHAELPETGTIKESVAHLLLRYLSQKDEQSRMASKELWRDDPDVDV